MPASNLVQNNGVAAGYGIGAGLSSFADAYMNALNYQLAKRKTAAEENYQDLISQAAMKNASTESAFKEAETQRQKELIPFEKAQKYSEVGADIGDQFGLTPPAPMGNSNPNGAPPQPIPPKLNQAPVNPLPQGLMGPQPSAGLIADTHSTMPAIQGPAQSPMGGLVDPRAPFWLRKIQAEQSLASDKELNDLRLKAAESGTNVQYAKNPQTGRPMVTSQNPYTGDALLKQQTGQATLQNEKTNTRSGNMNVVNQFDDDPNTKAARASAVPMNQVIQYMNNKNPKPEQKQAAFMAAIRVLDPGVSAEAKTPQQALSSSESLTDQVKSLLQTAKGSGMSDELLNGAISAAVDAHISNTKGMMDASQKQIAAAKFRGNEIDPNLQVDNAVMRAYRGALNLKKSIGGNVLPSQRLNEPGLLKSIGSAGKDVYHQFIGPNTDHALSGKIVTYKGNKYNVDAKGNMTEVGQ